MQERRPGSLPLVALAVILVSTAVLWTLALWPVAGATPEWLARTRVACFRVYDDGLPDLAGWITLIGEPIGLLAILFGVWGRQVHAGLRGLVHYRVGRLILAGTTLALAVGIGAAAVRVRGAPGPTEFYALAPLPRLDRTAPPLALVDQAGARFDLARLRGRPVLITFAFAHCETVCPLLVRDVLEVQSRLREVAAGRHPMDTEPPDRRAGERGRPEHRSAVPAVVVVTLDPWRDTPARLPAVAREWGLGDDAFLLSGAVAEVEAALDDWQVDRWRDERTGEVAHPALVYVVDRAGKIAFAAPGGVELLVELLSRLR